MSGKTTRTDFGTLLARAWQLYARSLHVTFPVTLLCAALPLLIVIAVVYYGLATAFEPALRVAQAVLRSLLESGFDEWAIGAAVEQVLASFGGLDFFGIILRALGGIGITVLLMLVLLPVLALCRLLLAPVGRGACVQALLSAYNEEKPRFSAAFTAARRRSGRLMAFELLMLPVSAAVLVLAGFICVHAAKLPAAGDAAAWLAGIAAIVLLACAKQIAAMRILDENARMASALGAAFRSFFTDWTYAAAGGLFYMSLLCGAVLMFAVDVLLMVLAIVPPIATVLYAALFVPLGYALTVVMAKEQIRRARENLPQAPEE